MSLTMTEFIESDNNLCPFFDIGIITEQDTEDSRVTIYTDDTHTIIRRIKENGLILNSANSNLVNSFLDKKIHITASGATGAGYFSFNPFLQADDLLINGGTYAIVFDIEGNPSTDSNIIGFIDTDTVATLYNPSISYSHILSTGSNLNRYYIFTADSTIINTNNCFIFGWSDLTGKTIDIYLTTLQLYRIDGISSDIEILSRLKGTTLCETKIVTPAVPEDLSFEMNGVICAPEFIEGS